MVGVPRNHGSSGGSTDQGDGIVIIDKPDDGAVVTAGMDKTADVVE